MRRALSFLVSSLALLGLSEATLTACGDSGEGGTSGAAGSGGGPENCLTGLACPPGLECRPDGTCGESLECEPDCLGGEHCRGGECFPDYTLRFVDPPLKSSVRVRLVLEVRPSPEIEAAAVEKSQIAITATFNAIPLPAPELVPVEGQDNRWSMDLDVSEVKTNLGDGLPLKLVATLLNKPGVAAAERTVNIDNRPPELGNPSPSKPLFRRDEPVEFEVTFSDASDQGVRVFAYLTGKGQQPPPPPVGWFEGTPKEGVRGVWEFSIDQRNPLTNLEGLEGKLSVHVWSRDLYGNAVQKDFPDDVTVSRIAWPMPGDMALPITVPPAVLKDGRLAVLVYAPGTGNTRLGLYDQGGNRTLVSVGNNLNAAHAPVVGADGSLYLVQSLSVLKAEINGSRLDEKVLCQMPGGTASKVALATLGGGEEAAVLTLTGGSLALVTQACSPTSPAPVSETIPSMSASTPVTTLDAEGMPVVIVGGQTLPGKDKRTLNMFRVDATGFTRIASVGPLQYTTLKEADLAIDDLNTVIAWPRYDRLSASLAFEAGFTEPPTEERVYSFPANLQNEGVNRLPPSPIVTATLVVFPTPRGIRALPRDGAWSRAVSYPESRELDFRSTPVVGEGDVIYAITYGGEVHAMVYSEVNGPELVTLWTSQLGAMGSDTFSAPLTLTCEGVLVAASEQGKIYTIITDSRGMDPDAPWPKYQHDLQNTGNFTTPTACR